MENTLGMDPEPKASLVEKKTQLDKYKVITVKSLINAPFPVSILAASSIVHEQLPSSLKSSVIQFCDFPKIDLFIICL